MNKIIEQAKQVKLLILDIDGVCTSGELHFNADGEYKKVFHVHDGLGIQLMHKANIAVAIISARQSDTVTKRMEDLGVKYIYQGYNNKLLAYEELRDTLHLKDEEVAYLGDDLPDLPVMETVGLSIAVANANDYVKKHSMAVTERKGGKGAVREVCEMILAAQDKLDHLLSKYHK